MNKNTTSKIILIAIMAGAFAWVLYPPSETLKAGMDIGGGTSLVYEINTQGLKSDEKTNLSSKMITVFRRRIDPANIQNIVWQPLGNTRFEIQMPLASKEARDKRQAFEDELNTLLAKNINTALIMRSLQKPASERAKDFAMYAEGIEQRQEILNRLADAYDQQKELRQQRDQLAEKMKMPETPIKLAGLDLEDIKSKLGSWSMLSAPKLKETLLAYLGGSDGNVDLLTRYTGLYRDWAKVAEKLADPETGKNKLFKDAQKDLDNLNLTKDQVELVLGAKEGSFQRKEELDKLTTEFPDRKELIEKTVAAYDEYSPFKGRLDDPKDLQRMMKGAGILEFRILPTYGSADLSEDMIKDYVDALKTKGPKAASDSQYAWFETENGDAWSAGDKQNRPSITGQFGNKTYVLASNKKDESMLHSASEKAWKLTNSKPGRDSMGKRSIDFSMDERGAKMFAVVTGKNIGRPLCILLDGIAISAPNIQSKIHGSGQITGSFGEAEVNDMVDKLNAGSLPARLIEQPISVKTIGPSIGGDNRDAGINAGQIGLGAVIVVMCFYYTLAGVNASLALLLNLLFILGTMALVRATFTLPGIAGIILTIGMSVDANVLIFERIREEQKKGSSLRVSIKNGYQKALRTILDSNLTTFITATILFWVASEEIKGFAIVLMLGIISSMFTALFVTRVNFEFLLGKKLIKDHLRMLSLFGNPNVNWMAARGVFFTISALLITSGLFCFFTRDNSVNNKYDIEFTGGTQVQANFIDPISRQDVEDMIHKVGEEMNNPAIKTANVYSIGQSGKQYEITTTETNKTNVTVKFATAGENTAESITEKIKATKDKFAEQLSNLVVKSNIDGTEFSISTNNVNKALVKNIVETALPGAFVSDAKIEEVVNEAILKAFSGMLEIKENLKPTITETEKITEKVLESYPELVDFLGGIKIVCQIQTPTTAEDIRQRINSLRFKPDMQNLNQYPYKILQADLNVAEPNKPMSSFAYVSAEPEAGFRQLEKSEWDMFVKNETTKLIAAAEMETSLPKVTQISPSIGGEAKTSALIAIVLSLLAIIGYIWIRFGEVRYGIAAIVALVHDVSITLGAVTVCTYIQGTSIGNALLIGDFKINLAMIAAFLTIIGYSLNDTIVVFDRIRENRHKDKLQPGIINDSINQTLSRTVMTSLTTFIVVLIMYIWGGAALRGFTFAMGFGIIIGTYSSIAIAAPILLIGKKIGSKKTELKTVDN